MLNEVPSKARPGGAQIDLSFDLSFDLETLIVIVYIVVPEIIGSDHLHLPR